jgi:hypothetical protein
MDGLLCGAVAAAIVSTFLAGYCARIQDERAKVAEDPAKRRVRRVGGLTFIRLGRLSLSYCITRRA